MPLASTIPERDVPGMKSHGAISKKEYDRRLPKSDLKGLNRRLLRRRKLSYPENLNPTKTAGM
jgi:hypothetical protein